LNDDNNEGDDAKDNHVESSLINISNSMSRKSQNKEDKFHIFPVSILLLIQNHIDDVIKLHNPQLCRYNPISGSTEVRHMTSCSFKHTQSAISNRRTKPPECEVLLPNKIIKL